MLASHASAAAVCVTDVVRRLAGEVGPDGLVGGGGGGVVGGGGGGVVGGGGGGVVGGGVVGGGVVAHAAVDTFIVALVPTLPLLSTPATAYW